MHDAEICNVAAGGLESTHEGIAQAGGTEAGIASEVDPGAGVTLEVCAEGLAEEFDAGIGEFEIGMGGVGNAAYVIFTKDGWLQHESLWNHDCVGCGGGFGDKMKTEAMNESRGTAVYNH